MKKRFLRIQLIFGITKATDRVLVSIIGPTGIEAEIEVSPGIIYPGIIE